MTTENDESRQVIAGNQDSQAKQLRNTKILALAIKGQTVTAIAETMGMSRTAVSEILNHSEEAKEFAIEARAQLYGLIGEAVDAVKDLLRSGGDNSKARVALAVLNGTGVLKQETENHHRHEHHVGALSDDELMGEVKRALVFFEHKKPTEGEK